VSIDVLDAKPIFDVVEGGYYVGIWYLAGRAQDFLAMLFKEPAEPGLQFRYRFRYYKDDKIHFDETDDTKSVYDCDMKGKSEDEAIKVVDGLVDKLIADNYLGTRLPWLVAKRRVRRIVRGDHEAMTRVILEMPFTHSKEPAGKRRHQA
jgi:hypothetical protein